MPGREVGFAALAARSIRLSAGGDGHPPTNAVSEILATVITQSAGRVLALFDKAVCLVW